MKTTFWQRYKYTMVYNASRLGSFWRGWGDTIDGTWEELKDFLLSCIRLPVGLIICSTWPIICLIAVVWKVFLWPLTYLFTRKADMEAFMEKHPEPNQRIKKNFTI